MVTTAHPSPAPLSIRRQWAALATLTLPVLLISLDNTILGFAVPRLSEALSPSSSQLLWIIDVYSFVLSGLLVTMGNLGDRIGRRRLLTLGACGFSVASVAAAWAPSAEALIAARAVLGLAGATLLPSTLSLIHNIFTDPRRRQFAIAVWAAMFAVGGAAGPLLGGFALEHFWWGSVFLLGLPVSAALVVAARWTVPESRDPDPGPFDLPSSALSMLAMIPAVAGVKLVAESGPSWRAGALLVVGAMAGRAFVRRQRRLPRPMIDVSLFAIARFRAAVSGNLMGCFGFAGTMFFLTQQLQLVDGMSPIRAGVQLLGGLVAALVCTLTAPALARRWGTFDVLVAGLVVAAAGFVVLTQLDVSSSAPLAAVAVVLLNGGFGAAMAVSIDAIVGAVPPERAGAGAAVSETAAELGIALGTALLGSVVTVVYRHRLTDVDGVPAGIAHEARDTLGAAVARAQELGGQAGDELLATARQAFTDGVRVASLVAALTVGGVAAWVAVVRRRTAAVDAAEATAATGVLDPR